MKEKLSAWEPAVRSITRIIIGFLITLHGFRNVFGVLIARAGRRNAPPMALDMLGSVGGYVEMIGGVLFILGLLTIPVAIILALTAAAGYLVGPLSRGPVPMRNGGEEAVIYVFAMIYFALAGAGAWSLDSLFFNKRLSA